MQKVFKAIMATWIFNVKICTWVTILYYVTKFPTSDYLSKSRAADVFRWDLIIQECFLRVCFPLNVTKTILVLIIKIYWKVYQIRFRNGIAARVLTTSIVVDFSSNCPLGNQLSTKNTLLKCHDLHLKMLKMCVFNFNTKASDMILQQW